MYVMDCEPITPIWVDVFKNDYKYSDLLIVLAVTIACLTQIH